MITNSLTEFKRRYMKAQELAADIGGVLQVIMIIGSVIVSFTTKNMFYFELINRFDQIFKTSEKNFRSNFSSDFSKMIVNHFNENKTDNIKIK
jgi:hypothetical protein